MKTAKDALTAFGTNIGLPNIAFNDDNICALIVGDDLEIWFEDTGNTANLRINAIVHETAISDASILQTLMRANFNGTGTGHASLGLRPNGGEVVLSQGIDIEGETPESLKDKVETFVKYAAFWRDEVPKITPVDFGGPLEPAAEGDVMMRI